MACRSRYSNTDTTHTINYSSNCNPCVLQTRLSYLSFKLTGLVIMAELLVPMASYSKQNLTELMRLNVHSREARLAQLGWV